MYLRMARVNCIFDFMGEFSMNDGQKLPVNVALAQSFKQLACEHPVEKITIKQITDGAGVIRPTFYHHSAISMDCWNGFWCRKFCFRVQPLVENGMINEAMQIIFPRCRRKKNFNMCVGRMEGQNSFGRW